MSDLLPGSIRISAKRLIVVNAYRIACGCVRLPSPELLRGLLLVLTIAASARGLLRNFPTNGSGCYLLELLHAVSLDSLEFPSGN